MNLRDHDQPCEHDGYGAEETRPGQWTCYAGDCPGGREVTIDWGAIKTTLYGVAAYVDSNGIATDYETRLVGWLLDIDAALGVSDGS